MNFATLFLTWLLQEIVVPTWVDQILMALTALLAIPAVYSIVTSGLRYVWRAADPELLVTIVSYALTGIAVYNGAIEILLPQWAGDFNAYLAAWLVSAEAFRKYSQVVYDMILSRLPILAGPQS